MGAHMKTTIDISDSLIRRCRRLAQEQHLTFRSLVEEGLDRVLNERSARKPFTMKEIERRGGGFRPGFEPDNWEKIREEAYRGRGT